MTFFNRFFVVSFILLTASWGFTPQTEAASDANITCSIKAEPSVVYSRYDIVTLYWETDPNVDSAYINNGIGFVPNKGAIYLQEFTQDFNYTLTIKKGTKTKECSTQIKVETDSNTKKVNGLSCTITTIPQSITPGSSVLLSWNAPNASQVVLDGYGVVHKNGQMVIEEVANTKTFVLRVSNKNSQGTCSATVYKNDIPKDPAPTCELDIIGKNILKQNENTTLIWRALNADFAQITYIGQVPLKGEATINPAQTTQYIMIVRDRYGREGFCEKTVEVQTTNTVTNQTNNLNQQPPINDTKMYYANNDYIFTSSNKIPLSYIPYTGASVYVYVYTALAILSAVGMYILRNKFIAV